METLKKIRWLPGIVVSRRPSAPHVHVKLRDGRDCTIDLDSLEINGRIAEREIREALAWIKFNQAFLLNEWRRNNP